MGVPQVPGLRFRSITCTVVPVAGPTLVLGVQRPAVCDSIPGGKGRRRGERDRRRLFLLERRIGGVAFGLLYFGSLVLAVSTTYFKHRRDPQYATLGASGAIAAVLFAAIVYFPSMKLFILPVPVPIPAPLFAVAYVAYSWYAKEGGRFSSGMAGQKINHDAHLIGALVGLAFVLVTDPGAYAQLLRTVFG